MMPLLRTEKVTWRQLLKHHHISLWGLKISIGIHSKPVEDFGVEKFFLLAMLVCNLPPHSMSDKKTMTEANLRLVRMGEMDLNVLI